jgi:hypothetical protein
MRMTRLRSDYWSWQVGREWIDAICCALVGVDTPPDYAILVNVMGWQDKRDSSAQGCMLALLDSGMT